MKSLTTLTIWIFILLLCSVTPSIGQEKNSEQRIKIVIADDNDSQTILDTVITGTPRGDTIILRNGKRIFIEGKENDSCGKAITKIYTVTTTSEGNDDKKEVRKEITIIGSDSDEIDTTGSEQAGNIIVSSKAPGGNYSYIFRGDDNKDSEKTKYVIKRDGMTVTVEGSEYEKVKSLVEEIENYLERKVPAKQHPE